MNVCLPEPCLKPLMKELYPCLTFSLTANAPLPYYSYLECYGLTMIRCGNHVLTLKSSFEGYDGLLCPPCLSCSGGGVVAIGWETFVFGVWKMPSSFPVPDSVKTIQAEESHAVVR